MRTKKKIKGRGFGGQFSTFHGAKQSTSMYRWKQDRPSPVKRYIPKEIAELNK